MSQVRDDPNPRYADAHVQVRDGLRMHYRDYPGSAELPPLLCLHGLTRNSRDFAEFAERYSPRFRVIVPEFRGRGSSEYDPQPARYNPLTYAGDVIELLDQLGIASAIFVGTSLGGLVTMTVAGLAPERIRATILNDIGPDINSSGIERILSYVGQDIRFGSWDEAAARISATQSPGFPAYTTEDWLKKARRICRERDGEIVFDYDMAIAQPFRTAGPMPKIDMWPLFQRLAEKPLLIIRGEISDLLSEATAARMREVAPSARFSTVSSIGHAPELDEPEAVAAIDTFLDSIVQAG